MTVIRKARKNMITAGINPSSDSSKLTRLFVIDGSARQTIAPIPAIAINKIPIIKPAIFITILLRLLPDV